MLTAIKNQDTCYWTKKSLVTCFKPKKVYHLMEFILKTALTNLYFHLSIENNFSILFSPRVVRFFLLYFKDFVEYDGKTYCRRTVKFTNWQKTLNQSRLAFRLSQNRWYHFKIPQPLSIKESPFLFTVAEKKHILSENLKTMETDIAFFESS